MSAGPVVALLPARNAAADLPTHLESVARFADLVVALDDGSTDATRDVLEAHPLVHTVLTNPRRETYAGWDDAANRNRLLDAARALAPAWIMSLDADELIPEDDAVALRAFLDGDADPDAAYLFRVFRMIDDLEHYDEATLWVGRLFAPKPEHAFPEDRLHFVPLPTAIPPERWRRTTIRIQHRAALDARRRSARFEKYREADPDHAWQGTYAHLRAGPGRVRPWAPRSPALPVLAHEPVPDPAPLAPGEPAITAVVIARDDESRIETAVRAVVDQVVPEPFEVVVVASGSDRTAAIVRERFPTVTLVELAGPALPGAARNAGLAVARGRYVTFPGSHIDLAPGSLAARLAAHRAGWAMVAETMRNGTGTWAGWASYFLDNASVLPARPSFAFTTAPLRCSYPRAALVDLGGFPDDVRAGEDTVVNEELFDRGFSAYREQTVVATHHSPCRTPGRLVRHHVQRGRAMGRILAARQETGRRRARRIAKFVVTSVPARLRWTHRRVMRWGDGLRLRYWVALPLVVVGAIAAWAGACAELLRPRSRRR